MSKLFFLLSGEHKSLPYAEVKAILEAENFSYKNVFAFPQVLCLESNISCIFSILRRSSLTRTCSFEIFRCKADTLDIIQHASSESYDAYIAKDYTFAVRIKRVQASSPQLDTLKLEREVGRLISESESRLKVRLEKPDKTFFGVITGNTFIFGLKLAEISPKLFVNRKPLERPFSHPSMMAPKLARCMVNLARPAPNQLVLDPFCGTGSILIEAGLVGCRILAADVDPRMIRGSLQNLNYFGIGTNGCIIADARRSPFIEVDCIVTDPPYGISTTTLSSTTKHIVLDFLSNAIDILPRHGYVVLSFPENIGIDEVGKDAGFINVETFFIYEHRSLTRQLVVLEKT